MPRMAICRNKDEFRAPGRVMRNAQRDLATNRTVRVPLANDLH